MMKLTMGPLQVGRDGCTEHQINELEDRFLVKFPRPYRRFLSRFGRDDYASSALRGSDYYLPRLLDLRSWAEELLRESGASFTLHPKDFVFAMNQGYQFYFFCADGQNDDPPVFYYHEGWVRPAQKFCTITDWLRQFGVSSAKIPIRLLRTIPV